jgi:hypothetical protein
VGELGFGLEEETTRDDGEVVAEPVAATRRGEREEKRALGFRFRSVYLAFATWAMGLGR